jgi:hypothetical protein
MEGGFYIIQLVESAANTFFLSIFMFRLKNKRITFFLLFARSSTTTSLKGRGGEEAHAQILNCPNSKYKQEEGTIMSESISIIITCKNLKDEDILSKSDPFVIIKDVTRAPARIVGKTEVVKNNLNPSFTTHIETNYFFETKQSFTAEVWDFDPDGEHDLLGTAAFTVGQLMSASGSSLTLNLQPKGQIILTGMNEGKGSSIRGSASFVIHGKQLKNMDTFGKSDPFFVVSRVLFAGGAGPANLETLFRSEVVDNDLNPKWKSQPTKIDLKRLCGGDVDAQNIKIEVFDEDVTENEKIGECVVSLRQLAVAQARQATGGGGAVEYPLLEVTAGGGTTSKIAGYLLISTTVTLEHSFLQLLKAGLQLNVAFSVDFTGSNLECKNPNSLHFYHPTQANQYIQSMLAVSDVVQEYDSDRQFPCFGFGAILPGSKEANHFFHLNLGPNPYISGMQAVIDTYVQTVQQIRFYGPTNFAPTIRNVANGARQAPGVYTILLIMTDGEITDMNDTIKEIRSAVDAPLSLLIVGVGNADFSSMERLDGDNGTPLASRDMVQFVPMRDFANRAPEELAAALLAEIPKQVSGWATLHPDRFPRPTLLVQSAPINV